MPEPFQRDGRTYSCRMDRHPASKAWGPTRYYCDAAEISRDEYLSAAGVLMGEQT